MSRIGRVPVPLPSSVKISQSGSSISFEGPKGKAKLELPKGISASVKDSNIVVERASDEKQVKALHGLSRANIANIVKGLTDGFSRELEIVGVGYRAQAKGKQLELHVGFSHVVSLDVPEGLTVETPKPTSVIVKGTNKQMVGQMAANIRRVSPPEPYKGKGIKYAGEIIRRKAGKAATGAKGAGAG